MQKCKKRTIYAKKVHLQWFPIQNRRFQSVVFVGKFQREERSLFVDETEENFVAFPHGEFKQALFFDPFEVALVAFNLVARPFGAYEDMHVLIVVDVVYESDDAAVAPFRDSEARLFPHLAQHAVLGTLSFLELAAHAEPFVVVEIVFLLGAVQHEVLAAAFKITKGCLFHIVVLVMTQCLRLLFYEMQCISLS